MSFFKCGFYPSFLIFTAFYFLFNFELARVRNAVLNRSDGTRRPCLVLDLEKKVFNPERNG